MLLQLTMLKHGGSLFYTQNLIVTYQKEGKLDSTDVSVICDNTELEKVNKLLGVIINKNLPWKFHIDKTAKSIYHNITLLRRIRKYLPHQTRITFYKCYIQPHIDYCMGSITSC